MTLQTTPWDSAEYLKTDKDIAAYLDAVLEEGDPALVAHALGIIARARGIKQMVDETGLARHILCSALSADGKPEFATVLKVISLGASFAYPLGLIMIFQSSTY